MIRTKEGETGRRGGGATLKSEILAELEKLEQDGLLRELRTVETTDGVNAKVNGRKMTLFCSNDYLGLAGDPRLGQAAVEASEKYGFGARASRLVSGHSPIHEELEQALARFHKAERALLFPSGFQGNMAVVTSLLAKGDTVILDRLAHASLVDAARLSGATLKVFPHNDVDGLAGILARIRNRTRNRNRTRILVLTESVYSMDGDLAPLQNLSKTCGEAGALLLVDEAHATGVWGEGRGLCVEAGIPNSPHLIRTGTLSKALGGQGGYLLAPRELRDLIINKGRAFIYSTALAPAFCGAGLEALRLVESEPERRKKLWERVKQLGAAGAIVPWILGSSGKALAAAKRLWDGGSFVPAIRFPTVARNQARLRITLSSLHDEVQVAGLARALKGL